MSIAEQMSKDAMESVYGDIVHRLEQKFPGQLAYVGFVNDGFNLDYLIVQLADYSIHKFRLTGVTRIMEYGPKWPWWRRKTLANERKYLPNQVLCTVTVSVPGRPLVVNIIQTAYLILKADSISVDLDMGTLG